MAIGLPLKRPKTLTEQAADAIRSRIVSGDFRLGEALSEITLAAELGVSKTPVREAFLQLKNEGLVDIQPQRGTFVFRMTVNQIAQLTVLRELLEVEALRLAMRENQSMFVSALADIVRRMGEAVEAGENRLYRILDADFHQQIISASRNEFLEAAYSSFAFRLSSLRNRLSMEPPENLRSLGEHQELARLAAEGDEANASLKLSEHIKARSRDYIRLVEQSGRPPPKLV